MDTIYAYLILCGMYFLVWLVFFFLRKDLRFELLSISIFTMPLGFTEWIYWTDYYRPEWLFPIFSRVGVEDLLWAGVVSGIGAVAYEVIARRREYHVRALKPGWMRDTWLLVIPVVGVLILYYGSQSLGINLMSISIAGVLVAVSLLIFWRKDLLQDAIVTGAFMVALTFTIYQVWLLLYPNIFSDFWHIENISGILFWGVPIEELLFLFAWGALIGPVYESIAGLKIRRFSAVRRVHQH